MIPKYTALEEVYQTARTMGPDGDYNKKTQHNMGIARGFRIHQSNVPSYKDYVLLMSKEENKQDITIALHPKYYNVILNGIEVFKVNGSDGNLAGPNPEPLLASPPPESFNPTSGKSKMKRRVLVVEITELHEFTKLHLTNQSLSTPPMPQRASSTTDTDQVQAMLQLYPRN
ncbi:hypothetical protein QQP08_013130 [Theobroma cacao]|nr:hypothetical protein QQP08_013130 [Theobroma cacao]